MTSKYNKNKKKGIRGAAKWVTDVFTVCWRLLWSMTEQTHGNLEVFICDDSKPKICQWWRHLYICLHQSKPMKILMKFSLFTYQGERKSLRVRQRVRKTLICECFCYGHIIAKKPGVNRRVNFLSILLFEL